MNDYLKYVGTYYECSWKDQSDYYDIEIGDIINNDTAWSYHNHKTAASQVKGYYAFETSKGVNINT